VHCSRRGVQDSGFEGLGFGVSGFEIRIRGGMRTNEGTRELVQGLGFGAETVKLDTKHDGIHPIAPHARDINECKWVDCS
jgi:hypothetical protein